MSAVDAVVVGAGPYGLSVGAHLRSLGLRVRVHGTPMDSWLTHMPEGMFLKSEGFATNLSDPEGRWTLKRFCAENGHHYADIGWPIPLEVFSAYGLWFAERAVPDLDTTLVRAVHRQNGGFGVEFGDGSSLETRAVVIATGISRAEYVPPELRGLPPDRLSHTSAHFSLAPFAGRNVLVVGAGQSALEGAALLHEAGAHVQVLARAASLVWLGEVPAGPRPLLKRLRWPVSPLGTGLRLWAFSHFAPAYRRLPASRRVHYAWTTLGPAGSPWLRDRVEGQFPVLLACRVLEGRVDGEHVVLRVETEDGEQEISADHVIAGTGYRVELDEFDFLDSEIRGGVDVVSGAPRLGAGFESSVPRLSFVGLPAAQSYGPVMRFVCGSGIAARGVASRLTRRRRTAR